MLNLSSHRKIQLAQALHRLVLLGRHTLLRRPMSDEFIRQGLRWRLNLDEGIDFAIWLTGGFERRLQQTYAHLVRPGMTVLDLGANIGAHTLPLARLVGPAGRVIAVEATAYAMAKLRANLALNPGLEASVVLIHSLLVADPTTTAPSHLYSSWPLAGTAEVHPVLRGVLKPLGEASVTTVDAIVQQNASDKVDWIKLDVDGHELDVLRGATQTLARHRPGILMEFAPYCHTQEPEQFARMVNLLLEARYDLAVAETGRSLPTSAAEIERLIPAGGSINVLASPRD